MKNPTSRAVFGFGFIAMCLAMAIVLYLEYALNMQPCALCVFQRVCLVAFGVINLVAFVCPVKRWLHNSFGVLSVIASGWGLMFALRQVHLQNNPVSGMQCGTGLNYLLNQYSFLHVFKVVFSGEGDCATVHLRVLGLSIAGWSALFFATLVLVSIFQVIRKGESA